MDAYCSDCLKLCVVGKKKVEVFYRHGFYYDYDKVSGCCGETIISKQKAEVERMKRMPKEKRDLIIYAIKNLPLETDRAIAKLTGTTAMTVGRIRRGCNE